MKLQGTEVDRLYGSLHEHRGRPKKRKRCAECNCYLREANTGKLCAPCEKRKALLPVKPSQFFKTWEYQGEEWSMPKFKERFGCSEKAIARWIKRGMPEDDFPKKKQWVGRDFIIDAIDPKTGALIRTTFDNLSKITGVKISTLRCRYRKGKRGIALVKLPGGV